mmetsp:Transcript_12999/g.33257  ORF Transcript_12999/g.33257 Transcript_12999/m.33257 type:complete len:223 (+) Transcript_12999:486-1154(+)
MCRPRSSHGRVAVRSSRRTRPLPPPPSLPSRPSRRRRLVHRRRERGPRPRSRPSGSHVGLAARADETRSSPRSGRVEDPSLAPRRPLPRIPRPRAAPRPAGSSSWTCWIHWRTRPRRCSTEWRRPGPGPNFCGARSCAPTASFSRKCRPTRCCSASDRLVAAALAPDGASYSSAADTSGARAKARGSGAHESPTLKRFDGKPCERDLALPNVSWPILSRSTR